MTKAKTLEEEIADRQFQIEELEDEIEEFEQEIEEAEDDEDLEDNDDEQEDEMKTRFMGRITLDKVNVPGITAELKKAGYDVDVCPDELIEDPDDREEYAFIEASKDVDVAPQNVREVSCAMLTELGDIANRHGRGACDDCGPVPDGHIPHNYETPAWIAQRRPQPADDKPSPDDEVKF